MPARSPPSIGSSEHRARREQRARLVDDQREHLVAAGGRRAGRRHAARAVERAARARGSRCAGRSSAPATGTANAAAMPAETAPTSTTAMSTGACKQQRAGGRDGGAGDRAREHQQSGARSRAAPPRDTRERDGEPHASGPAEKRRERCGQAQPVAHDAPLPTIAPRYHARRAVSAAPPRVRLGRVRGHPSPPSAARAPARLLRRRRARRRDRRADARPARPADLRAQADRAQHPRRAAARAAGRDLRRERGRRAGGRDRRALGARRRARGAPQRRAAATARDRRDLPARDQGAQRGQALRRPGPDDLPDRPRRATRKWSARWARRPTRSCSCRRVEDVALLPEPQQRATGVPHADDALGRRDDRHHRRAADALPDHRRAAQGRHLLRHDEPPGGRQVARARGRSRARDRLGELVELAAPGRRDARPRRVRRT